MGRKIIPTQKFVIPVIQQLINGFDCCKDSCVQLSERATDDRDDTACIVNRLLDIFLGRSITMGSHMQAILLESTQRV